MHQIDPVTNTNHTTTMKTTATHTCIKFNATWSITTGRLTCTNTRTTKRTSYTTTLKQAYDWADHTRDNGHEVKLTIR